MKEPKPKNSVHAETKIKIRVHTIADVARMINYPCHYNLFYLIYLNIIT
jgi:hypothetical protein